VKQPLRAASMSIRPKNSPKQKAVWKRAFHTRSGKLWHQVSPLPNRFSSPYAPGTIPAYRLSTTKELRLELETIGIFCLNIPKILGIARLLNIRLHTANLNGQFLKVSRKMGLPIQYLKLSSRANFQAIV
jgi:hypothetical protein